MNNETHARNTLCDLADTLEQDVTDAVETMRIARADANRYLRQRNDLLEKMHNILAACQNWNGGWVGKGQSANEVIPYIAEAAGSAIAEVGRKNGQ